VACPARLHPDRVLDARLRRTLVWEGPWSFGDLWILVGLAAWIGSFGVGFLFIRPQGEKQMKEIVARYGPTRVETQRHARRLGLVARVQLLALFLVVVDMLLKPTSDDPWTLVVLAAILVVAAVVGALSLRRFPEAAVAADSR
jgi:hypothetical protein